MALLAEQIVQEWLTRQAYFTMRGIKVGNDEIDLLASKHIGQGHWEHLHAEVQVSVRPVSYISALTKEKQLEYNIAGSRNAARRTPEQLEAAVKDWVIKKFTGLKKAQLRKQLSNSDNWKFMFVHGVVKSPNELELIKQNGIEILHISTILNDLLKPNPEFTTYAATDIIELLALIK